jgi:long-chain acyl-CoA synthetase
MTTLLHETLEASAAHLPRKVALVCGDRRVTFAELDALANGAARLVANAGARPGDRVVTWLGNSVDAVAAIYGILKAGCVFVPLHPHTKPPKVAFVIRDCDARVLIADGTVDDELRHTGAALVPSAVIAPAAPLPPPATSGHDLAAILYTSGSTGVPRGVMVTHANMLAALTSITEYLENVQDDVILQFLPLSFDYGLYNVLMPVAFGGTVILEPAFVAPHRTLELLRRERVTGLPLVPTIAAGLARLRSMDGCHLPALRYITSTGQVLPPAHIQRLGEIFPGARIFSMYGLTECKRVSYLPPDEVARRPSSVGRAMPRTEAWIVDANGERIEEPGVIGELVVRGPHVMRGYWNRPVETAQALRGGVLHTGDLFRVDEEGFLYYAGRMDDLIKTAGHRVSPKEIENVVCTMDGVIEAVAFGVADELLGHAISLVVRSEDPAVTPAAVLAHCSHHLERAMVPRHVEVRRDLPHTDNGKVARREIAAQP